MPGHIPCHPILLGSPHTVLTLFPLKNARQLARTDMPAACRRSLAHGPLLLLRYTLGGLPWGALAAAPQQPGQPLPRMALGQLVERLLDLLEQVRPRGRGPLDEQAGRRG